MLNNSPIISLFTFQLPEHWRVLQINLKQKYHILKPMMITSTLSDLKESFFPFKDFLIIFDIKKISLKIAIAL